MLSLGRKLKEQEIKTIDLIESLQGLLEVEVSYVHSSIPSSESYKIDQVMRKIGVKQTIVFNEGLRRSETKFKLGSLIAAIVNTSTGKELGVILPYDGSPRKKFALMGRGRK